MDNENAERLDKIETKIAYLEDFLQRLQDEVVKRHTDMETMIAEHGEMKSRLLELGRFLEEGSASKGREKPPHY
jgi:SlyX protein